MNNATKSHPCNDPKLNHLPVLPGEEFTWSGRTGSVEASDMGLRPGQVPAGFNVRSHRTGVVKGFFYDRQETDGDGEPLGWVYRTVDGSDLSVIVHND